MNFRSFFALILLVTFVSCDNEPLEGDFIVDDPSLLVPSFTAEFEDFTFEAIFYSASTVQGITTITGIRSNGDIITLNLNGSGVGSFDMVTQGYASFGIDIEPFAFYTNNPGGSGSVAISQYDTQLGVISGTFSFIASRQLLDAGGLPILDGNGNPVYDLVVVSGGEFMNIPLESDGSTGGDIDSEFYAEVDGIPFVAGNETSGAVFIEASNTLVIVGESNNRTIQINIVNPEPGTYDLGAETTFDTFAEFEIDGQTPYSTLLTEGGSGTVTITNLDFENNKVSGTFSFIAGRDEGDQTVTVANGYFNSINIAAGVPGDEDDFLNAFVDGNAFAADDITVITTEMIAIQGIKTSTGEALFFNFPADLEPGTYNLTFGGEIGAGYFDGGQTFESNNGLLVLIENSDSLLRFAFNFQASEEPGGDIEHTISQGLFQYNL